MESLESESDKLPEFEPEDEIPDWSPESVISDELRIERLKRELKASFFIIKHEVIVYFRQK